MNEHHVCAVVRITARFAARFPARRVAGRAARPSRVTVPRFKDPRHV